MKTVLQLGLVVVLVAVMVPFAMPETTLLGAFRSSFTSAETSEERSLAERDADVRRRMALAREAREDSGHRRATRRSNRGTVTIEADRRGHYVTEARINKRAISVLVDTGASSIAMSQSTARDLGVRVRRSDFVHTANTANGQVQMAQTTLDRVRIGDVELRDVTAAVLPDGALDDVLLGMSFLGRLKSFRSEGGKLVLVQ